MTDKVYIDAELIADTRESEQKLGFRNVAATERRMLFQADEAYVEMLIPAENTRDPAGGWLFGQFIRHTEALLDKFDSPIYAILEGVDGLTGAVRVTEDGEFAVPFQTCGDFTLRLEPRGGPTVRAKFTH